MRAFGLTSKSRAGFRFFDSVRLYIARFRFRFDFDSKFRFRFRFRCLIWAQTAAIWWKNDQIWPKLQFLQVENDQKNQECLFSGNKSPCGSALVRRKLLETYPNQINSFKRDLKKWHFPKKWIPDCILPVKIIFYRKLKWSVWSIWTYSTRQIFKFVSQKVFFDKKGRK